MPELYKTHFQQINTLTKEEIKASKTGLRFNEGKLRWGLVHYKSLEPLVRVLMAGAEKYDDNNWMKGLNKREILECLQRHLAALMDGEINDKETGLPHIGHVMANAMFYSYFELPENANKSK
jgi:hypothetical protein